MGAVVKVVVKGAAKGVAEDAVAASAWSPQPRPGGLFQEGSKYGQVLLSYA